MKKKIALCLLVMLAVAGYATMPRMVESTIPTAYYITPNIKTYENVISCTGTIQSEDVRQIYLQSSLVAEEVFAAVGDVVKKGDTLLKIDEEMTGRMGLPISVIRDVTDEADTTGASAIDWAALASSYGMSAVLSGGTAAVDQSLLEALLNDNGLGGYVSAAYSGSIADEFPDGEITAPISGVVTAVDIQKNVPASPGKAIVTIADNENYKVLISIREEDVARVQVQDEVKVRGVGFSGTTYTGIITKIYPTARKTLSGTSTETVVDAEVTLHNPDKRLKPGFSAKVDILCGQDANLITVPYEAIKQDENNNEFVYLYEDGKLKKQVVVTGQELTDEVEILDGVSQDSVVVYNPSDAIKEGAMINLRGRAEVENVY